MLEHKPQPPPLHLGGEKYSSGYHGSSWDEWRDQHTSNTGKTYAKVTN